MQPHSSDDFLHTYVIPLAYRQLPAEDLLARSAAGDTEAFIALVCLKYPLVAGVCYTILGQAATAEDVIQEVFIAMWRQCAQIRSADALDGWLRKTARNIGRKHIGREAKRREVHEQWSRRNPEAESDTNQPDIEAVRAELVRRVRQVLAEQSEEDQRVLRVAEKSEGDAAAAETMGLTVSAYRVRLHRARRRLANLLRKYGIAPAAGFAAIISGRRSSAAAYFASRWATNLGKVKLLGVAAVVIASIIFGLLWARPKPEPPAELPVPTSPVVVEETLQQKNVRLFNEKVRDQVVEALTPMLAGRDGEVRVTDVRAFDSRVECTLEGIRDKASGKVTSRVRFWFCILTRRMKVYYDANATGQWKGINPNEPIVLFLGPPRITLPLKPIDDVKAAFAQMPADSRALAEINRGRFRAWDNDGELIMPQTGRLVANGRSLFAASLVPHQPLLLLLRRDQWPGGSWVCLGAYGFGSFSANADRLFVVAGGRLCTRPVSATTQVDLQDIGPAIDNGELAAVGDRLFKWLPGKDEIWVRTAEPRLDEWRRAGTLPGKGFLVGGTDMLVFFDSGTCTILSADPADLSHWTTVTHAPKPKNYRTGFVAAWNGYWIINCDGFYWRQPIGSPDTEWEKIGHAEDEP
ncbi:MAG TPA: sigma-70 family RNA polymerase sigma factor [Gemmataceae bacterium]|jgi:RNA polymerase sigma-70 factor (ECF subfamily)|nr:sigma-70 family RNA polymerase sigma factor [Gemmataceae bacterium]